MSDTPQPKVLDTLLAELGVTPIVHAGGTKSSMGGSAVASETAAVMHDTLALFFDMNHLLAAVGAESAKLLGVESAAVVAGAASGCVLAAAALRNHLPPGSPANVITQRRHYGRYTYLYEQANCTIREIGTLNDCPLEWYAEAIDSETVGIMWLEGPGIRTAGACLDEVCDLAAEHGLPVVVDAAAMAYPFENVRSYLNAGSDLVVISGGKLLGGPQASGFVLGSTALTTAIQTLGFPHQGVGRAHKITKEAALGAYAAVRRFVADQHPHDRDIKIRAERIVGILVAAGIPAGVEQNSRHLLPAVVLHHVRAHFGAVPSTLSARELAAPTPVFFAYDDALDELYVEFASLDPAHDTLVQDRLLAMNAHRSAP